MKQLRFNSSNEFWSYYVITRSSSDCIRIELGLKYHYIGFYIILK